MISLFHSYRTSPRRPRPLNAAGFRGATLTCLLLCLLLFGGRASAHTVGAISTNTDNSTSTNISTGAVDSEPVNATDSAPTPADGTTSASTAADLFALEHRLFVEEYPTQSTDQRLARLEKFVFGNTRTGPDSERLTSLLLAVPALPSLGTTANSGVSDPLPTDSKLTAQSDPLLGNKKTVSSPPASASTLPEPSSSTPSFSQSDLSSIDYYPTVTALEEKILGHGDKTAPLSTRLANLETKAFGKPDNSGKDFATRVDRLKSYVASKYGNDDYLTSPEPALAARSNVPPQALNLTSQLALLEKSVFAKTYSRDGVISRLDRLEKAVYPEKPVESFSSVPDRVERLMTTIEPQTAAQSSSYTGMDSNNLSNRRATTKHHFWHKVGSLLGTAGMVAASALGSSMMGGGYGGYPGMGYPGSGYPGYGSGMMYGGPRMGGMY